LLWLLVTKYGLSAAISWLETTIEGGAGVLPACVQVGVVDVAGRESSHTNIEIVEIN
jgi:hypothetical protein